MSPQVPGGGLLRTAGLPQLLSGFGGAGGAAPWPGSRLVLWSVPRCGRMPPGHGRLSPLCRLPQHPPGLRVPLPARLRWGRDHPLQPHVSRAQGARGVASVWGAQRQDTAILRATGNTQWTSHGMGMFGWHGDHARPPRGMGIFGGHGDHVLPPHGMGTFGGTWGPRTPFPCPGDAEGTQELAPTIPVLRGCVGETGAAVGGPHTVPPYVSPPQVLRGLRPRLLQRGPQLHLRLPPGLDLSACQCHRPRGRRGGRGRRGHRGGHGRPLLRGLWLPLPQQLRDGWTRRLRPLPE